ncbi:MAG: hypothetical protein EAY65_03910 [Alphaproteobacteria bacterium]|nr:MAG: hypothetical protein EAY65_03910 [Alphaproteobacteria bacterium]
MALKIMSSGNIFDEIIKALNKHSKPLADAVEKNPQPANVVILVLEAIHTYFGFQHGVHCFKNACSDIRKGHLFHACWEMTVASASFLFGGIVLFVGGLIPIPLLNTLLISLGSLIVVAATVFILFTMAFFVFVAIWRIFVPYQP